MRRISVVRQHLHQEMVLISRRNKEFTIVSLLYVNKDSGVRCWKKQIPTDDVIRVFITYCITLEKDNDWKLRKKEDIYESEQNLGTVKLLIKFLIYYQFL